MYLCERSPDTIEEFTRIAEQYLIVHKKNMAAATKDRHLKKLDNGSHDVNKKKNCNVTSAERMGTRQPNAPSRKSDRSLNNVCAFCAIVQDTWQIGRAHV